MYQLKGRTGKGCTLGSLTASKRKYLRKKGLIPQMVYNANPQQAAEMAGL